MKEYHVDALVMGDDWAGKFDFIEEQTDTEVVYLPRTPEISTSQIKNDLNKKKLATSVDTSKIYVSGN